MDFKIENYYSKSSWDTKEAIDRAQVVLDSFDPEDPPKDISGVLELYNLYLLLKGETKHSQMIDLQKYDKLVNPLMACVAKFFSGINTGNIKPYADDCYCGFWDDFWNLVWKFKIYERIERFPWIAESCGLPLYEMLKCSDLVKGTGYDLSQYMRESNQTARTLIDYYLRKRGSDIKLYMPNEFSSEDREKAVKDYISGEDINANFLMLIVEAPKNMAELPIDDRMKINAEKRIKDIYDGKIQHIIVHTKSTGLSVAFSDKIQKIVECQAIDGNVSITYNVNWIKENLDYPTLLNNFIYIFGFVDRYMRWKLSEKASDRGALEDSFLVKGVKSYISGQSFRTVSHLSNLQMIGYYETLSKLGVALEDVIKWFFEEYLSKEFSASGFICNVPQATDSFLAKCKLMVSAMDGVAKQYRMYIKDGEIDRELYERSSEHMRYEELGSFQKCKYIYCIDKSLIEAQHLLFSDQSHITYTSKTKSKYDVFAKMITAEEMRKTDFYEYQWREIEKLITVDAVKLDGDIVRLNKPVVSMLSEFYYQEVICYQYQKNEVLDTWIKSNMVQVGATLFSRNESSYINYMFNQAEYSNGRDLRNRYIHDSCPKDKDIQKQDYFEIFKIMVLMVIKINEEFCLRDELCRAD